jgi:antitoxin (DNA-binding transcriptional repressor) of toxin-antitoxin stability system
MRKVGSREFKNRMGRYLSAIRNGQSLLITDRGKLVAKVSRPDAQEAGPEKSLNERLSELEAQGKIRLAKRPLKNFRAVASKGKSASQMLIEDRR